LEAKGGWDAELAEPPRDEQNAQTEERDAEAEPRPRGSPRELPARMACNNTPLRETHERNHVA